MDGKVIGKRIKEARKALGMTQKEFAGEIRIGDSSLSKIEKGINKPSGRTVEMICLKFGIKEKWIMEGKGGMMENASENKENKETIQEARLMVMAAAKMLECAREKVCEFEETTEDANDKAKSYTCYEDLLCVNRDLSIISDMLERI